jgi:hypothetical protein
MPYAAANCVLALTGVFFGLSLLSLFTANCANSFQLTLNA